MKAFTFKTQNNNYYLYSPVVRNFLPISYATYTAIANHLYKQDRTATEYDRMGYFEELHTNFNREVDADDIYQTFANTPQIVFEVTTQCNLSCKYCCYGDCYETFTKRKSGTLRVEYAKTFLLYYSEILKSRRNICTNTPLILSFYGGEPLLNTDVIKQIVEFAKELSFPGRFLRFSLTTNATHLYEHIDYLVENDFSILVSLDGDERNNSYRTFRNGKSSFDCVMANLQKVREKYPNYFKKIRYNSVYTNLSDTDKLFQFFFNSFGKTPTISPLHFSDGETISSELNGMMNKVSKGSVDWYDKSPDAFLEIPEHKMIIQILMYMTDTLQYNELSFMRSFETNERFPTHSCIPFSKRLFVSFDGRISPCEKVNRDAPLGHIYNGVVDIDFSNIAKNFNTLIGKYKTQCMKCAMVDMCNHCAFTSTTLQKCPEFKSYGAIVELFGSIFTYMENNSDIIGKIYQNIVLK